MSYEYALPLPWSLKKKIEMEQIGENIMGLLICPPHCYGNIIDIPLMFDDYLNIWGMEVFLCVCVPDLNLLDCSSRSFARVGVRLSTAFCYRSFETFGRRNTNTTIPGQTHRLEDPLTGKGSS